MREEALQWLTSLALWKHEVWSRKCISLQHYERNMKASCELAIEWLCSYLPLLLSPAESSARKKGREKKGGPRSWLESGKYHCRLCGMAGARVPTLPRNFSCALRTFGRFNAGAVLPCAALCNKLCYVNVASQSGCQHRGKIWRDISGCQYRYGAVVNPRTSDDYGYLCWR